MPLLWAGRRGQDACFGAYVDAHPELGGLKTVWEHACDHCAAYSLRGPHYAWRPDAFCPAR